ncbi:PDZ domain-containing protein [Aristophania vespae]|uniref:PDZ domain-containing protein n=1 Tax=Aristophania vespae TaxID=2697033 RepID=A0A6P1NG31_9PROT|nr:S41 family peptidase [Aristophania vespae]QHI95867.1 PDZ domain-containing protein [Aristophania vespae]UMM63592.1 hypothetical protein DM15PD_05660 [Aristophania vespae]
MKFKTALLMGFAFSAGIGITTSLYNANSVGSSLWAASAKETAQDEPNNAETVRLLTLFGTVMDVVHSEYVEPISDKKLINNALDGLVGNLDPHSSYMTPEQFKQMQDEISGQFGGLGLQVQADSGHIRVVGPIEGTPAARAHIMSGDVITMINHKNVADLTLDEAVRKMRGAPGTKINITILRPKTGKTMDFTITREIIHVQVVRSALYGKIGYLRLAEFDDSSDREIRVNYKKLVKMVAKTPAKTLSGLILDLRADPGGKLDQAIAVSRDFIKSGEIVSVRGRHPENNQHWHAKGTDITHGLPIVVLTNAGSASASEIVAGALKDHRRAIILGERTFGKGSVQTLIPIADQGAIRLTTARYYTPSGRSIQGRGITPDVEVKETRDKDEIYTYRESDLAHVLSNIGGKAGQDSIRSDLPADIIKAIPHEPPEKWPSFNPEKPETDFQLQQAIHLLNALSSAKAKAPK